MIDVDKLFSINREEYIEFLSSTEILPIDNIIKHNGIKYELTIEDIKN